MKNSTFFIEPKVGEDIIGFEENDNIMLRRCTEKMDFYQEVLLLENSVVLRPGRNSVSFCCLPVVLILHFQTLRGADTDRNVEKRLQSYEEERQRKETTAPPVFKSFTFEL